MLVLERRYGESIMIGDNIKVTITKIRKSKVHLGIEAPRDFAVHRQEVYGAIKCASGRKNK